MKKFVFAYVLSVITFGCFAQQSKYKNVDEAVEKLGPLNNFNVAVIADTITEKFTDNEQKARAIFYWIANNIQIDPKGTRQNDDKHILSTKFKKNSMVNSVKHVEDCYLLCTSRTIQ